MRYRKKPVEIQAVQFDGDNFDDIHDLGAEFLPSEGFLNCADDPEILAEVFDKLHSTWVGVKVGQWIIKGVQGEFYPCDPDVFEATYEPVSE